MIKNTVHKVVIVGGGTAGWMTAAAISKILSCQNYSVELVESEQIGTVGVGEATIPMIQRFNNVLGLDENEFVRETNATFKLGVEFCNWKKIGESYIHPFGGFGVDMDGITFTHYWMRWKKSGGSLDYTKFSAEIEAARMNKFMRTTNHQSSIMLPPINYAFHFDASLYAIFLRRFSEKRGVKRTEGKIIEVKQNGTTGFIESLNLDNGQVIQGDFFIDCSGFKGILIEETLKAGYTDWSKWLPVNRAAAVPCESVGEFLPYTKSTAQEFGWQWKIPLQHRTGNGYVYCNDFISEAAAAEMLLTRLEGKPLAEPKTLRFVTGVRKKCWIKNCVAMGLASGFLEPLESTSIHLVQLAIAKLMTMFPRDGFNEILINRFNTEMHHEYDEVKDFLIAHYKLTERDDTPFWQYVKHMPIPESLQERLDIFRTRGEVMVRQTELFKEASWFAVLAGQGLMPDSYHPIADAISDDELGLRLTKIRASIQNRVGSMPNHSDFIRDNCRSNNSKIM